MVIQMPLSLYELSTTIEQQKTEINGINTDTLPLAENSSNRFIIDGEYDGDLEIDGSIVITNKVHIKNENTIIDTGQLTTKYLSIIDNEDGVDDKPTLHLHSNSKRNSNIMEFVISNDSIDSYTIATLKHDKDKVGSCTFQINGNVVLDKDSFINDVSSNKLNYLSGSYCNIQEQIDLKHQLIYFNDTNVLIQNNDGIIIQSPVPYNEVRALEYANFNIQEALDSKQDKVDFGTGSSYVLINNGNSVEKSLVSSVDLNVLQNSTVADIQTEINNKMNKLTSTNSEQYILLNNTAELTYSDIKISDIIASKDLITNFKTQISSKQGRFGLTGENNILLYSTGNGVHKSTITNAMLVNYVNGLPNNIKIQDEINTKQDRLGAETYDKILVNNASSTVIDSTSVSTITSNQLYNAVKDLSSSMSSQLSNKMDKASGFDSTNQYVLTAEDNSIISTAINANTLNHLKGVTYNIQDKFNELSSSLNNISIDTNTNTYISVKQSIETAFTMTYEFIYNSDIDNTLITQNQSGIFMCISTLPLVTNVSDCILFELGNNITGTWLGFRGKYLRFRTGTSSASYSTAALLNNNIFSNELAFDVSIYNPILKQFMDGKEHCIIWEIMIETDVNAAIALYIDGQIIKKVIKGNSFTTNYWSTVASGHNGGFGKSSGTQATGEGTIPWKYVVEGNLQYYQGVSLLQLDFFNSNESFNKHYYLNNGLSYIDEGELEYAFKEVNEYISTNESIISMDYDEYSENEFAIFTLNNMHVVKKQQGIRNNLIDYSSKSTSTIFENIFLLNSGEIYYLSYYYEYEQYRYILNKNIIQAAFGIDHVLALTEDRKVYSIGNASDGKCGNGSSSGTLVSFTNISALNNISYIACGDNHSLFVKRTGEVYSCGLNTSYQLGIGNSTNQSTPVQVKTDASNSLLNIKHVAAGADYSVFLTKTGQTYGCGNNNPVQFKPSGTATFATATGINDVIQIACVGNSTLYLKNDRNLYGIGRNTNGILGTGSTSAITAATQVAKLSSSTYLTNIEKIIIGYNKISLKTIDNNFYLLDTDYYYKNMVLYPTSYGFYDLLVYIHTENMYSNPFQVTHLNTIYKFNNKFTVYNNQPKLLFEKQKCLKYSKQKHNYSFDDIKYFDFIKTVTNNNIAGYTNRNYDKIPNHKKFVKGKEHFLFIGNDNNAYGHGYDVSVLGTPTNFTTNYLVDPPYMFLIGGTTTVNNVIDIACGDYHSLFVTLSGTTYTTYACGYNIFGQLGNSSTTNSATLINHTTNHANVRNVYAGGNISFFVKTDGTYSCGYNAYGQLGIGNAINQNAPTICKLISTINFTKEVKDIKIGKWHTMILTFNGEVFVCGLNKYNTLGNPDNVMNNSYYFIEMNKVIENGYNSIPFSSEVTQIYTNPWCEKSFVYY